MRKPLFVEFYGLPGCGKSTISHQVASKLRYDGFLVDEPSYDIDRNYIPFLRKLKKLSIYFLWLVFRNNYFRKVNAIVERNGYSGIAKIEQISNVLQKISVYRSSGENRIVIWDQGLVQAAISLALKEKACAEDNLKSLMHILDTNNDVLNILISVEEKVALERMAKRPTNDSRVERLKDDNQRQKMLARFRHEIDAINNGFDGVVINGTNVIEIQVERINSILMTYVFEDKR